MTDFGCGSGILAIAALKLGAESAVGVDNDPQALIASADNANRNGVADRLRLFLPEDFTSAPADIFVANILAGPLGELAPTFAAATKPGAPFAISGILVGQQENCCSDTPSGSTSCVRRCERIGCGSAVVVVELITSMCVPANHGAARVENGGCRRPAC